jgi:hypothetical protein
MHTLEEEENNTKSGFKGPGFGLPQRERLKAQGTGHKEKQ